MLCGNYILSNRSEWTFYFLSSVQFNFTIGVSIILLASMNWILILVTAIFAVITLSMPKIMEKKTSSAMDKVNKKNDKLLNTIEHWLGGLQELRRYSAYSRLIKQLNRASNDYVETSKKSF